MCSGHNDVFFLLLSSCCFRENNSNYLFLVNVLNVIAFTVLSLYLLNTIHNLCIDEFNMNFFFWVFKFPCVIIIKIMLSM